MFKIFWYQYFKYPILMNDADDGIKSFTERKITDNLTELRKKITSLNVNPISNVEHNAEHENVVISDLVHRENKRKKNILALFIGILCLSEMILNYISFLVVIPGGSSYPVWFFIIRASLTIILTLLSVVMIELFLDNFLHKEIIESNKQYGIVVKSLPSLKKMLIYFGISCVLLTIIGFIVETRQFKVEQGVKNLSYYGLIMLSIIVPIGAGMCSFEWKLAKKICIAASGKRNHLSTIRQNEAARIGDKGKVANSRVKFFADLCSRYWKEINDFKSVKTAFDKKKGIPPENLGRHKVYIDDYKTYQQHIESILNTV